MTETKRCPKCGETKPLTGEFWNRDKSKKDGFSSCCKVCVKASSARWYKENLEKAKAKNARYRKENPEKVKARKARWREENPEKVKASQARYRKENPEKEKARKATWVKDNPEKKKANSARWEKEHPEKVKAMKARKVEDLTDGYIKDTLKACNAPITPEAIEERRDQILRKRLCVPKGTDIHQKVTDQPTWAMTR